jgi:NTE family protein
MAERIYRAGIVLSGGGARGFAHIGVLQALNEAGIFPDVISGTSAGALAGVLYADGYTPGEIMEIMKTDSMFHYIRPVVPKEGFLQISGIEKILHDNLRARKFEDLKIPLFVAATDLNNGTIEYFSKGELLRPVIASASIPVLFKPVIINNIHYVDGGVLDNLPIDAIKDKCEFVIGSSVNPTAYEESVTSMMQIAERTFFLSLSREVREKSAKFDMLVAPVELKNYKALDPVKAAELFVIGYKATKEKLKYLDVKRLIASEKSVRPGGVSSNTIS